MQLAVRVCVCVCVHAAFSTEEQRWRVVVQLASLISCLIDCEKFEDDILRGVIDLVERRR